MTLPNIDIINGLTGLEIIVTGYILGFFLIFKHARKATDVKVKKRLILSGIGLISVFHSWFGVSASFLLMILGFPPLGYPAGDPNIAVLAYAWGPALGGTIWAWIALDLFKKGRLKIPITAIVAILSVIFVILIYSNPSTFTSWKASPSGLPSTGIRGAALALLAVVLIIMVVILGPIILFSASKLEDKSAKWRRYSMGIGVMLVSLLGIIDAGLSDIPLIGLAIIKASIFTSIFLIYEGIDKGS
ncbi:MAG: hypothetical protein EAX91_11870 [Candidatus Lokiarchaeota archaeon]|nr:hypothetical protein [Candidatus Lokiarchaeota archaeon]